jgi:hypothetical protein
MKFFVASEKPGPLRIHELLEQHANSLWIPDHPTPEQASSFVLDHFRRQVETELKMVKIDVTN